jgi:hydroxymethylpyrimidine/phosphomethylpyrimidine kinase
MIHTALTIAGSDPSGGAGIQADLKTFASLNVYGMAVIAALTAQNTIGVAGVEEVRPEFVGLQLESVLADIPPAAVKTGMLGSADVVDTVARILRTHEIKLLVVDTVLASSTGTPLLEAPAVEILKRELLPLAFIVTPNAIEASLLTGVEVRGPAGMEEAARRLHRSGARHVLVKGGHVDGDAVDVFFDGRNFLQFSAPRIPATDLHGTGCVLSAAITGYLALGCGANEAVEKSKNFVTEAIRNSLRLGRGSGPINPLWHFGN